MVLFNHLAQRKRELAEEVLGTTRLDRLPSYLLERRKDLPHVSAVYVVFNRERTVLYVGATVELHRRWSGAHHCLPKLEPYEGVRIAWREMPREFLIEAEDALIYALNPLLNRLTNRERIASAQRDLQLDPESEWVLDCFQPQEGSNHVA